MGSTSGFSGQWQPEETEGVDAIFGSSRPPPHPIPPPRRGREVPGGQASGLQGQWSWLRLLCQGDVVVKGSTPQGDIVRMKCRTFGRIVAWQVAPGFQRIAQARSNASHKLRWGRSPCQPSQHFCTGDDRKFAVVDRFNRAVSGEKRIETVIEPMEFGQNLFLAASRAAHDDYRSISKRRGSSSASLTRTRKVTAPLPSTMR